MFINYRYAFIAFITCFINAVVAAPPKYPPFFFHMTDSPTINQVTSWNKFCTGQDSWGNPAGLNKKDHWDLGVRFNMNAREDEKALFPSVCKEHSPESYYSFDDAAKFKDIFFADENNAYLFFLLMLKIDHTLALLVSQHPGLASGETGFVQVLGSTQLTYTAPARPYNRGISKTLAESFAFPADTLEIKIDITQTDMGALLLLAPRYFVMKLNNEPYGLDKIWQVMEKISEMFVEKAIFNNLVKYFKNEDPYRNTFVLIPSSQEMRFLISQYTSVLWLRDLLSVQSRGREVPAFSTFPRKMKDLAMGGMKGTVLKAGDNLFKKQSLTDDIKKRMFRLNPCCHISEEEITSLHEEFHKQVEDYDLFKKNRFEQMMILFGNEMKNLWSTFSSDNDHELIEALSLTSVLQSKLNEAENQIAQLEQDKKKLQLEKELIESEKKRLRITHDHQMAIKLQADEKAKEFEIKEQIQKDQAMSLQLAEDDHKDLLKQLQTSRDSELSALEKLKQADREIRNEKNRSQTLQRNIDKLEEEKKVLEKRVTELNEHLKIIMTQQKNTVTADESGEDCMVCLDTLEENKTKMIRFKTCTHYLDEKCWDSLNAHQVGTVKCPMCRTPVSKGVIQYTYGQSPAISSGNTSGTKSLPEHEHQNTRVQCSQQ
ncbi:hypothetical protein [Endozoicomonas sp. Mp262]|uniref:hypothetical protein n=1 Tax=Endozoicomonas sp. Mp262 TaxID=2919499 RepID=UPI0021D8AA0F